VDDCGDDNTHDIVTAIAANYPHIQTHYIKHTARKGAAAGRITGYTNATNDYILFGEDDASLEPNYTTQVLEKFHSIDGLGLVSGRIIYMLPGELPQSALQRFGDGFERKNYLDKIRLAFNVNALISNNFAVPFTHAIFLTTKSLLSKYPYDPFYANGNGFREETDFQLNIFTNGYKLLVTNETHCFHLHNDDVPSGGQRISGIERFYWNVSYTSYLYDKYFDRLKLPLNIGYSKTTAKFLFAANQIYLLFIRPQIKRALLIFQRLYR